MVTKSCVFVSVQSFLGGFRCSVRRPSDSYNLFASDTMLLLTERKGRTGKCLAQGHGIRTERSEVQEPNIFPSGSPNIPYFLD